MEQSNFLEEFHVWNHPPEWGIVLNEERNKKFFEWNQTDFFFSILSSRWLHTIWCGSEKWFLVYHGRFRLSTSRGIQSQTVHAEGRVISCSAEVRRRYQNNTYVTGCIVGEKCWWSLERGWRKRIIRCMDKFHKIHYWAKGHLTDIHGPGGG